MTVALTIALFFCMLLIAIEDFKYRAVHTVLFIASICIQVAIGIYATSFKLFLGYWGINLVVLIIQIALLYLFFFIKNRKYTKLLDRSLGKGDLCFFIILTAAFSPVNFLLFYISSLIITLLIALFIYRDKQIPLAGWLALFYLPVVIVKIIPINLDSYIDLIKP